MSRSRSILSVPLPRNNRSEHGVLLLCVPHGWDTYISKEFQEVQDGLVSRGWVKRVIGSDQDADILNAIRKARAVLLWEAYEFLEQHAELLTRRTAAHPMQTRLFFCDDVHYFDSARRHQRLRAFTWADRVFATYPYRLKVWYPEVAENKIEWVPHSAASYFQPVERRSSNLILLSGSRTWPYPFRQFCQLKLPASICDVMDHPGYPGYPGDKRNTHQADEDAFKRLSGSAFSSLIAGYPAMLVCGSIFGYLVAKVFEGMACGCLIIADRTSLSDPLSRLGFTEGADYIGTDILHVIEDCSAIHAALSRDEPLLLTIADQACRKVHTGHTTAIRAAQIDSFCRGVLKP